MTPRISIYHFNFKINLKESVLIKNIGLYIENMDNFNRSNFYFFDKYFSHLLSNE